MSAAVVQAPERFDETGATRLSHEVVVALQQTDVSIDFG